MPELQTNVLYYGDNLDILRRYIPDASVDLIYLDPPFNSNRDYNVIFRDESGNRSDAQLLAFEDTWHWGPSAESTYAYLTNTARHEGRVPDKVSTIIAALRSGIGENQMMAYLVEMAVRLVELHRVLKPTGSLYLHCDPTASHYLKLILDSIFGPQNFRNEVIWRRSTPKGLATSRLPSNHDLLLAFAKDREDATWVPQYMPHDPMRAAAKYSLRDEDGRAYQLTSLLNPNPDRPNLHYEFKGVTRTWRWTRERMEAADAAGLIVVPRPGAVPRYKRYLDEQEGIPVDDVWTDISPVNAVANERLGYPTQKPVALLDRIIESSSNPGDIVLDPFCGCGTAIISAQSLDRRWIGIDITYLSVAVMKARIKDSFGVEVPVLGQPTEVEGAANSRSRLRAGISSSGGRWTSSMPGRWAALRRRAPTGASTAALLSRPGRRGDGTGARKRQERTRQQRNDPRPQGHHRAGEGRDRSVPHSRGAEPRDGARGDDRRLLHLTGLGQGLSADPDPHHP